MLTKTDRDIKMVKDIIVWLFMAIMNAVPCPENSSSDTTSSSVISTTSATATNTTTPSDTTSSSSTTITSSTTTTSNTASFSATTIAGTMTSNATMPDGMDVFSPSDRARCRLVKICRKVCCKMMLQVFLWGTKKDETVSLVEYLRQAKRWTDNDVNKRFSKIEVEKLKADSKGETYDITLLYKIIPWACEKLAPAGHNKWITEADSLEYYINQVKHFRNLLAHRTGTFTGSGFVSLVEEIRFLLNKMLTAAGTLYNIAESDVQSIISTMNFEINNIRDCTLLPQDMQNYRIEFLLCDLVDLMRGKGKEELKELFVRNDTTCVNPASFIVGCNWNSNVDRVFTPLKLKDGSQRGQERDFEYEKILLLSTSKQQVTLVEGVAGSGKTTITRHLVFQWCCNSSTIKALNTYDLLILMECRNSSFTSLSELLDSLMPKTRQQLQEEDLLLVFKRLKLLILIDGLDEMNDNSEMLLSDILHFNDNNPNAQILVFSRPEKLEYLYQLAKDLKYTVNHIKVAEIPDDKRETFVEKYHDELKRQGQSNVDITDLLKYLRSTQGQLNHVWGLPLHLVMLTVLWISDHSVIKKIRSPTGLHMAFVTLSMNKLCQRLANKVAFSTDELMRKSKIFLFSLSRMALQSLRDDIIVILTTDQILKLQQVCDRLALPPDEVMGAFLVLKRSWTTADISIRFTHKTQQEFQASLFMNHVILGGPKGNPDERKRKELEDALLNIGYLLSDIQGFVVSPSQDHELIFPLHKSHLDAAVSTPQTLTEVVISRPQTLMGSQQSTPQNTHQPSSSILEILHDLYEGKNFEALKTEKFKNTLCHLLRLMHMEGPISPDAAQEIIQLLKKTGFIQDEQYGIEKWMGLLSEINQDTVAKATAGIIDASYLHRQVYLQNMDGQGASLLFRHILPQKILIMESSADVIKALSTTRSKCHVTIESFHDFNVKFYLEMMTKNHFFPNEVKAMKIDDPTKPEWKDFLQLLATQQVSIFGLMIVEKSSGPEKFDHLVSQVLLSCGVRSFCGHVKYVVMKKNLKLEEAHLSIQDAEYSLAHINLTLPNLKSLHVRVDKSLLASVLTPSSRAVETMLTICSLTDSDIKEDAQVIRALQPLLSTGRIKAVTFQSGSLTPKGQESFTQILENEGVDVKVTSRPLCPLELQLEKGEKLREQIGNMILF